MIAAVVGLGAIGTPLAWLLAGDPRIAALRLIDGDRVERSNLPRQVLYRDQDIGRPKAIVLAERLGHPEWAVPERLDGDNAARLLDGVDVVGDGTDNWPTRLVIDATCRRTGRPWLFLSAIRWEGQAALMAPDGPCLRCLFGAGQDGPACFEVGIVGPVAGWVASEGYDLLRRHWGGESVRELRLVDGWRDRVQVVRWAAYACPHGGDERRVG
jgi:molybdopterin/thiamine biosynthesis adenylyltransferase